MTLAQQVKNTIENSCHDSYSLMAGQGKGADGQTVHFPVGALLRETRNEQGTIILARYAYADGSQLLFSWGPGVGAVLTASVPSNII